MISRSFKHKFIFLFCLISASNCSSEEEVPSELYGLPFIKVYVDAKDWQKMFDNIDEKLKVPAQIYINGQNQAGMINPAGASSLTLYKKNFQITLQEDIDGFGNEFRLAAQTVDTSGIQSLFGYKAFAESGISVPLNKAVVAQIGDGQPSLYLMIENVEQGFFDRRNQSLHSIYKARNNKGNLFPNSLNYLNDGFKRKEGPEGNWDLKNLILTLELENQEPDRANILQLVQEDQMLKYLAVHFLIGHVDGTINNYILANLYSTSSGTALSLPEFQLIPWDLDRLFDYSGITGFNSNSLMLFLTSSETTCSQWLAALSTLINSTFQLNEATKILDDTASSISTIFPIDPHYQHQVPLEEQLKIMKEKLTNQYQASLELIASTTCQAK